MLRSIPRDRGTGAETCGFCFQTYVLELERHCVACDRPACSLCLESRTLRAEIVCPECGDTEKKDCS